MKKSYVLLKTILQGNPQLIPFFRENQTAVYCRNTQKGKTKKITFRALHDNDEEFWLKSGKPWSFYVEKEIAEEVKTEWAKSRQKGIFTKKPVSPGPENPGDEEKTDPTEPDPSEGEEAAAAGDEEPQNFGRRYGFFRQVSLEEREEKLREDNDKLRHIEEADKVNQEERLKTLMDVTADSALANKATVEEAFNLENADAQLLSSKLINQTDDIVDAVTRILSKDTISNQLFSSMMDKSDGSTVRHMTRVFLKSMSFLLHYNDRINQYSLAHKMRTRFDKEYKRYYMRLLPGRHASEMSMAQAFEGGLQPLSGEYLHDMSLGFLLHDIGKQEDIEYYEGDEAYDRETIVKHALQGEAMLKDKTSYTDAVAYMAGFHHEYYNDPQGYGTYRRRLALARRKNASLHFSHAVTYRIESVRQCRALSFFPAKMLEIVDVYDALTDPDRKYKEPLSSEEALKVMKMEFVQRHIKLDPILFDIFIDYLKTSGEIAESK